MAENGAERMTQADAAERVRALIQRQQNLGADAIAKIVQLLGYDGRFVIVMRQGAGPTNTLFHNLDADEAISDLREAYQGASKLVIAPPPMGVA